MCTASPQPRSWLGAIRPDTKTTSRRKRARPTSHRGARGRHRARRQMTRSPGEPRVGALGGRQRIAATSTVVVSGVSRLLRIGDGSVIGGRVGLAIDPGLVKGLSLGKHCALVSGTNGKTTTTRFLVATLGGPGPVASSSAGANLPAGLRVSPRLGEFQEGCGPRGRRGLSRQSRRGYCARRDRAL